MSSLRVRRVCARLPSPSPLLPRSSGLFIRGYASKSKKLSKSARPAVPKAEIPTEGESENSGQPARKPKWSFNTGPALHAHLKELERRMMDETRSMEERAAAQKEAFALLESQGRDPYGGSVGVLGRFAASSKSRVFLKCGQT